MDCGIHNFFFDTDRKENTTVNIQKDKKKINDLQIPSFIQASDHYCRGDLFGKKQDQVLYY